MVFTAKALTLMRGAQFEQQLRTLKKLGDPIEMRVQVRHFCE